MGIGAQSQPVHGSQRPPAPLRHWGGACTYEGRGAAIGKEEVSRYNRGQQLAHGRRSDDPGISATSLLHRHFWMGLSPLARSVLFGQAAHSQVAEPLYSAFLHRRAQQQLLILLQVSCNLWEDSAHFAPPRRVKSVTSGGHRKRARGADSPSRPRPRLT